MNRDSSYYFKATEFLPARWLQEAQSDPSSDFFNDQRHGFQPFSAGPRICMGQLLAWAEMRLVLCKLLWSFDVTPSRGDKVAWEDLRTFLLVEKKPIKFGLEPRVF